jgi:hypothetical protein
MVAGPARAVPPVCATYVQDLAEMVRVDQALRKHWKEHEMSALWAKEADVPDIVRQTALVDGVHARRLKSLVKACGWPKKGVHGAHAVGDAWLLAQHAEPEFQRAILPVIEARVKSGEAPPDHLAYLADRIAAGEGRPQLYGTQLVPDGPCSFAFLPMDDRARVEERRHAIGWPPLEEYRQTVIENSQPASCPSRRTAP